MEKLFETMAEKVVEAIGQVRGATPNKAARTVSLTIVGTMLAQSILAAIYLTDWRARLEERLGGLGAKVSEISEQSTKAAAVQAAETLRIALLEQASAARDKQIDQINAALNKIADILAGKPRP